MCIRDSLRPASTSRTLANPSYANASYLWHGNLTPPALLFARCDCFHQSCSCTGVQCQSSRDFSTTFRISTWAVVAAFILTLNLSNCSQGSPLSPRLTAPLQQRNIDIVFDDPLLSNASETLTWNAAMVSSREEQYFTLRCIDEAVPCRHGPSHIYTYIYYTRGRTWLSQAPHTNESILYHRLSSRTINVTYRGPTVYPTASKGHQHLAELHHL